MRTRSWKVRLGLTVSTVLAAGAAAAVASPAAMAAPVPQGHTATSAAATAAPTRQLPADSARPGGGSLFGGGRIVTVKAGDGSVRIGDRVCAGNCNSTVNGSNGGHGGICAGLCDNSANGGTGTPGTPGRQDTDGGTGGNGGNGGNGGICAGICTNSAGGGTGGTGGTAAGTGTGGRGGNGGAGGICLGLGCGTGVMRPIG
ncbi:hypothetical protein [Streptomyces sp. NPDC059224]|uniref:hypothetical protein n=1 Tax=Streptomyces sp. NPDC059224 TaxID=3346775 RepID=UPI0036BF2D0A